MNELKPCPFCGGEAVLLEPDKSSAFYRVGCNSAHCIGANAVWHAHTTEAEAIAAWNARAERTCRDVSIDSLKQFYCSECECTVDVPLLWGKINYCPNCGAKVV